MKNNRTVAEKVAALHAQVAKIEQKAALLAAKDDGRLMPLVAILESISKRKSVGTSYLNASHPQSFRSRWYKTQLGNLIFDLELKIAQESDAILRPQIEAYTVALTTACEMVQNGEDPTDFVSEVQAENSEDLDNSLSSDLEDFKHSRSRYNDLVKLPAKLADDADKIEMAEIERMILSESGIAEDSVFSTLA